MKTIILLDFSSGTVHIFKVRSKGELDEAVDRWCWKQNIRLENCEWMSGDNGLDISVH